MNLEMISYQDIVVRINLINFVLGFDSLVGAILNQNSFVDALAKSIENSSLLIWSADPKIFSPFRTIHLY